MLAKLNFYNKDKLFYTDTTTDFKTQTSLREYFNRIKSFIVKSIVLNLEDYEIRELSSDFDRDIDVDIYCNSKSDSKSEEIASNQKKLFDFKEED
ncbi:MAG: hypothetical protein ISP01_08665 [Methanobrevibacter arboriphilus]|uniref:Uncharacterized protein n=1 Tax=Methanobrevibacter arboriphilus TaxID=39441 RepID=A0A843AQF0_METAZ|nr:hypothetical protein [Methanobrevibacter arboriphilus]MBF4469459.1 hypothetical protein [Methanobrevibacter arboriphilus]